MGCVGEEGGGRCAMSTGLPMIETRLDCGLTMGNRYLITSKQRNQCRIAVITRHSSQIKPHSSCTRYTQRSLIEW